MRMLTICLFFLMSYLMATFLSLEVKAESCCLILHNVEITPIVAQVGEMINVSMSIRNNGDMPESFYVTTSCGDSCVENQTVSDLTPKTSKDMIFRLNTSALTPGNYSIKVMIEKVSGQQKIYDLGKIKFEDVTTSETSLYSQMPWSLAWLIAPIPALVVGVWILRRRTLKQKVDVPEGRLPHLVNEILKFEERIGTRVQNIIAEDQKYVY